MNSPFFHPNRLLAQAKSTFQIDTRGLPVISFGELLTFAIRGIFIVAGLLALFYALMGGLAWITSGGKKEEVQAARDKIQAAIVGIFVLIIVLTIMYTLETAVFKRAICFGISCDVSIPRLNITPLPGTDDSSSLLPGGNNEQSQNAQNAPNGSNKGTTGNQLPNTGGGGQ